MPKLFTTFALDPEILIMCSKDLWDCMEPHERRRLRDGHARLCLHWERCGVLMHDEKDIGKSRIVANVQQMTGDIRKIWQGYLNKSERFKRFSAALDWKGVSAAEGLESLGSVATVLDLACLADESASPFGLNEEESIKSVGVGAGDKVELCRFSDIDQSECLGDSAQTAQRNIPKDMKIVSVWNEWFLSLAQYSKRVTIVDRYGGKDGACIGGLKRFLSELDGEVSLSRERNVTLYVGYAKDTELQEISNAIVEIKKSLTRGGIKEIQLFLCRDSVFKRVSHDRFVRFDNLVCELGSGISVFDGHTTHKNSMYTVKVCQKFHKDVLKDLRIAKHNHYPQWI